MDKACEPGLSKVEISRLQVVSSLAKNYRDGVADYLNYRGLELRLVEMEKKYQKMIDEYGKVLQEKAGSKKGAGVMRPDRFVPHDLHLKQLEAQLGEIRGQLNRQVTDEAISDSSDPVEFFTKVLGFKRFPYQVEFIKLFCENQFVALRWCRQSGKSWIVAGLLLWYAVTHSESNIAVVGPSWRQTKRVISMIGKFARKLPAELVFKPQKTYLHFPNGSSIEAFPNNPETIRGPTLHVVYGDEMNFIPNDEDFTMRFFSLWGRRMESLFAPAHPGTRTVCFGESATTRILAILRGITFPWSRLKEPNGPLKENMMEKIRKQFGDDPIRWRREMEAEWAEDEDVWLAQSLIVSCVGTAKNCGVDLAEFKLDKVV